MNKKEIVQEIRESEGYNKKDVVIIVEKFINIINESLSQGEPVKVDGLGTFDIKTISPRKGRNPRTGKSLLIDESRKVTFIGNDGELSFKPVPSMERKINQYKYQFH